MSFSKNRLELLKELHAKAWPDFNVDNATGFACAALAHVMLPKLLAVAEAAQVVTDGLDFDHNGWQDPAGMWELQKRVHALTRTREFNE